MKTMKWLIKREFWEHKGALLWTPAVIALIQVVLFVTVIQPKDGGSDAIKISMADWVTGIYTREAVGFCFVLGIVAFFYCLSALHDERRDRSILFWKSLPVSDLSTVMSKLLVAAVVAPIVTLLISALASILTMLSICFYWLLKDGADLIGPTLMSPALYLTPLRMVGLLPLHFLCALPSAGWLLLVSSMARTKAFLWGIGIPLTIFALGIAETQIVGIKVNNFLDFLMRMLLGVVPGVWITFGKHEGVHIPPLNNATFLTSWSTLGDGGLWLGAAAGLAMIALTVWVRRRREEG